jgi:hypothetical protein
MRKRERYERSDVPRGGKHTTAIALVVLAVIVIGVALLVSFLWRLANQSTTLGDDSLSEGIAAQGDQATIDGYTASTDDIECVLVLTVDDVSSDSPTLGQVQILSLDATSGTGVLVALPLDTKVTTDSGDTTVSELFASDGAGGCIAPLSEATGVPVSHVVVVESDFWDQAASLSGSSTDELMSEASDLLSQVRSDMDANQMVDLLSEARSIGIENLTRSDAVCTTEDDGAGGTRSVVDQALLGLALGTLVAAG